MGKLPCIIHLRFVMESFANRARRRDVSCINIIFPACLDDLSDDNITLVDRPGSFLCTCGDFPAAGEHQSVICLHLRNLAGRCAGANGPMHRRLFGRGIGLCANQGVCSRRSMAQPASTNWEPGYAVVCLWVRVPVAKGSLVFFDILYLGASMIGRHGRPT